MTRELGRLFTSRAPGRLAENAGFRARRTRGNSAPLEGDEEKAGEGDAAAISDPLRLTDHEAFGGPANIAQALSGEEQPDGQRKHAEEQEQRLHGAPPFTPLKMLGRPF